MLNRLRERRPVLYCIVAEVLFLLFMMVGVYGLAFALVITGADWNSLDEYALTIFQELAGTAVALVFLFATKRQALLTRRGCGFLDGLLIGMYPVGIISYSLAVNLMLNRPNGPMRSPFQILTFVLAMFAVGVAEELLFRGVIAETLLEKFGSSTLGVWKACLLSGLLFGCAHLTNLIGSEPFGVLMQCLFTTSLGALLGAIYFRCGNIWVPIFIHGYMDVAGMLIGGLYGTQTVSDTVSSYDTTMLPSILIYLLPVLFLLRRKRIGQVALNFQAELAPTQETPMD